MAVQKTAYASVARTATPTAYEFYVDGDPALHVVIDVTAADATPSVVPTIDAKDDASGKWYNLLTAAAITGTGVTVLKIGRGITPAANLAVSDAVPGHCRLVMTHADADSITYSAAVHVIG